MTQKIKEKSEKSYKIKLEELFIQLMLVFLLMFFFFAFIQCSVTILEIF